MTMVLVAYGTKHGATAQIAEEIGKALSSTGLQVTVLPAGQVDSVAAYDAVVLGSGVYAGMWRKPAVTLLKRYAEELAQKPVWLFSSGPTGDQDPLEATQGWRFPTGLQPTADAIQPRDIALMRGAIDEAKLGLLDKFMVKAAKAPFGDFRDWETIRAWAGEIAAALQA
jgi:menaquinone-dependent protoporphyrinogen oxidase